ncbi:hypothetical protein ACFX2I_009067 [Malus domestica]
MASSSSDPGPKTESGGGSGGGGAEPSEAVVASDQLMVYRGVKKSKKERGCTAKERISKMPPCAAGKRSSIYRGVTRHRWTGRYEGHLWDKSTWNQNQNKKGKQGAYDDEEAAARAYDLAALKYWGPGTLINFPVTDYPRDLEEMQNARMCQGRNTLHLFGERAVVSQEEFLNIVAFLVVVSRHCVVWVDLSTSIAYIMVQALIQQQKVNFWELFALKERLT